MSNYPVSISFFGNTVRAQTNGNLICLNDLFIAGNALRLQEGRPALQMNAFLSSKATEDYVTAAAQEWCKPTDSFITKEGRGRTTRTYVHVSLAMLAAESLSPRFHAHVHRVFLEGKLLEFRERGGTEFKTLNAAIDEYLPGREGKDNKGVFITLAKILRGRILGPDACTDDWNTCGVAKTHLRYEYENKLSDMLRLGVVRDFEHLKELAGKV